MLMQFRTIAKSPVVVVLMGLLVASFLLWGIRGTFSNFDATGSVVKAGPRAVSPLRFRQMFEQELKSYNQQSGQTISPQDAIKANLDRQVADGVAADEAFAEFLRRVGIVPSDKLVLEEIRKAPRFFNPVSGVFDRQAYEQFLQQIGLTGKEFDAVLRDQIAQDQFAAAIAASVRAPALYGALAAASQHEGRTFADFIVPSSAVPAPSQPSDAELNAFLKQNAERLKRPEMRALTLVRFSAAAIAPTLSISPADVEKRFAFEKDTLSTPERRSLVQIPVRDAQAGAAVSARLRRGEDPAAVAKSLGVPPIVYTQAPKTAIADRKVAEAAFTLPSAGISGPVQGDLGMAVLKLTAVSLGHTPTLAEVQAKIEAEVRKDAAQSRIDQQVKAYEDARSGGANLTEAAKRAGAPIETLPAMSAQGQSLQVPPPAPPPPKLLQAAFTLPPGGDSDIVDLGQGEYGAVQVTKILPPSPPSLDEVRPQLTRYVMNRDLSTRLQAKVQALADQVRKGQPMPLAAASIGATVGHAVAIERGNAGQGFSADLLGRVFAAKPGEVVIGTDVKQEGLVVARLEAVVPASGAAAAQAAANQRPGMNRALLQDLGAATRTAARALIKPSVDYRRARTAVGGDPAGL